MKTLVLGLGNPILSDDGVGLRVVQELQGRVDEAEITLLESDASGLNLVDLLIGYEQAIIIDAIQTKSGKVGQIHRLKVDDLAASRHAASPHDVNLATALELGKKLGLALPREIIILAVEVADVTTFSEECTPRVAKSIPVAVEMILREIV